MSQLLVCDFDGTITERDTLHVIVQRYGTPGVWEAIDPRLRSGEITLEQAMEEQFAGVRATPHEVSELVASATGVRPGFHELVAWARENDWAVSVLSSGFRSVIEEFLARAGLGDLPVEAHEARFDPSGTTILWSDRGGAPCELCGRRCKRHDLTRHRAGHETVVYVGDGVSDRCAAPAADMVFARDHLAAYLDEIGTPYTPFDDFDDVRVALAGREPAARS